MNTIVIIQARMGSSRLPGKIMLPLSDGVELKYVVERCKAIHGASAVIVATSHSTLDDQVASWCSEFGYLCFRGSEEDVLSRYYECACRFQPDYVLRVTGDCPFTDYHLAMDMINAAKDQPCDIVRLEGQLPRGLEPQLVSFKALEWMYRYAKLPHHREHVTYYAYEYPDQFQSTTLQVPLEMQKPHLRITVDTAEDYRLMQEIADRFKGNMLVSATDVVRYLVENPDIAAINADVQQKPVIA